MSYDPELIRWFETAFRAARAAQEAVTTTEPDWRLIVARNTGLAEVEHFESVEALVTRMTELINEPVVDPNVTIQLFPVGGPPMGLSKGGRMLITPWKTYPLIPEDMSEEIDPAGIVGKLPESVPPVAAAAEDAFDRDEDEDLDDEDSEDELEES